MAYTPMPPEWIEAGKPTKEEIFQNLKANQESFNADIEALKQTARIDIFDFTISGYPQSYTSPELDKFLPVFRAPVQADIVNVLITLLEASVSGDLELQLYKSVDNGINWSPILSVPVTVSGTTVGSVNSSVSFVDLAAQNFDENDMLKVGIVGLQVDQGAFHISVYGEIGA